MASSPQITALNQELRSSPEYAQWMQTQGIDPSQPVRLSDQQRRAFAAYLRTRGWSIPQGTEIDPAGNINENEGFGKQVKRWGPVVGAGAVTAFGIPGLFPGLLTKGGTAAAGAAGGASMNQAIPPAISAIGGVGGGTGMVPPAGGAGGLWGAIKGGAGRVLGGGGDGGGRNAWQTAALAALAGLPALVAAKNSGMSDEEKAIYAQLTRDLEEQRQDREPERALRDTQLRRINYQNPLYQAVSRLAMNRLPTSVQQPFGEF